MRTKKVNRYWCDYCNKAGLSSFHMKRHETGCTLNPNRECGVCKMVNDGGQKPLSELISLLPDPAPFLMDYGNYSDKLTEVANAALPALRAAAGDCPACIMAAIRQRGIKVPMVSDFNWTNEMKSIWDEINESKRCADEYY